MTLEEEHEHNLRNLADTSAELRRHREICRNAHELFQCGWLDRAISMLTSSWEKTGPLGGSMGGLEMQQKEKLDDPAKIYPSCLKAEIEPMVRCPKCRFVMLRLTSTKAVTCTNHYCSLEGELFNPPTVELTKFIFDKK